MPSQCDGRVGTMALLEQFTEGRNLLDQLQSAHSRTFKCLILHDLGQG